MENLLLMVEYVTRENCIIDSNEDLTFRCFTKPTAVSIMFKRNVKFKFKAID